MKLFYTSVVVCIFLMSSSSIQAEIITIDGVVKSVDVEKRTITVESGAKEMALDVGSKAKMDLNGEEAGLDAFKKGQRVSLSFHDQLEIVVRITADLTFAPPEAIAPFNSEQAKNLQDAWAKHLNTEVEFVNSTGMKMVLIPAGEFQMGSPGSEEVEKNENQHFVRITKPFYLQTTEVTQDQWKSVMMTTPWERKKHVREGGLYPAVYVSWGDAVEFCRRLSHKDGETYRLPTEAEWEYACRAGTIGQFSFGNVSRLSEYAWTRANAWNMNEQYAHKVSLKLPNQWGLFDMHGNVWEWCSDWYDSSYYKKSPTNAPSGPSNGLDRVIRGGGFNNKTEEYRSVHRGWISPEFRHDWLGFRVTRISPFDSD